ncbi:lysophospholipid acyltransferase family protein [Sulfurospirillum arcachonense]|uniref:lysophospholipid acyltransferase family protein n=1 Tax=Sulfurospirillum arcachonense TaxID=57666 RepID=UPI0004B4FB1F|nr:lysophospholipid acyltransferase family protein [Sulfurospirillum arcachonense]
MIPKIKGFFIIIEFVMTVLMTVVLIYIFQKNSHAIRRAWGHLQTYFMNFKIIQKNEPNTEAKLILINHQSLVDIIALETIYPKDLCWVAKQELRDIPLFGHIIAAPKMISIDRNDKRSIIKIIKLSKERINQGRTIALFPEGTRGQGEKLGDFHNGGKILAEKLNLKVQPVVLVNTKHIFDSQKLTAHSGNISVIYLDIIDPKKDENWFTTMRENMQKALDDELANYTSNR